MSQRQRRKKANKTTCSASASARAAMGVSNSDEEVVHRGSGGATRAMVRISAVLIASLVVGRMTESMKRNGHKTNVTENGWTNTLQNMSMDAFESTKSSYDEFYQKNVQPLLTSVTSKLNATLSDEKSRPGYRLAQEGAKAKHPIIFIPGFITAGLEVWGAEECAKNLFRQRIWGSLTMAQSFFADRNCWRKHLSLDRRSGLDPEGIRLRAAHGFDAADYFIATFWVFAKLIENLADVGYDGERMSMMSFDWRLGYRNLEKRDGYFTKLKYTIEAHHETTGEKVVLISHSMGGTVTHYFLQWVVAEKRYGGGGGGKNWVETFIHSWINLAGTLLGVPKATPALLSGELKDTAVISPQLGSILEHYFSREWRKELWTSWGSLYGMLPKGGDRLWGIGADLIDFVGGASGDLDEMSNMTTAVASLKNKEVTSKKLVPYIVWSNKTDDMCSGPSPPDNTTPLATVPNIEQEHVETEEIPPDHVWSLDDTLEHLYSHAEEHIKTDLFSHDSQNGWKKRSSSKDKQMHWHDPAATQLPKAPSMRIYCVYGVGLPTERAYHYKVDCSSLGPPTANVTDDAGSVSGEQCSDDASSEDDSHSASDDLHSPFIIDTDVTDASRGIQMGVRHSDGDGSVALLSLGYMCQKWKEPRNKYNPHRVQVFSREKKHKGTAQIRDPGRGGPESGEHCDILGNDGTLEDVVRIATDFEVDIHVNHDEIKSDLMRIMDEIDSHPNGGL